MILDLECFIEGNNDSPKEYVTAINYIKFDLIDLNGGIKQPDGISITHLSFCFQIVHHEMPSNSVDVCYFCVRITAASFNDTIVKLYPSGNSSLDSDV